MKPLVTIGITAGILAGLWTQFRTGNAFVPAGLPAAGACAGI